ncbi:MAG: TrmH family RNA methyltransferase [Cytophagales bacterium]|nr:MAG: TrmH family RNA methyltransferase [Cytophagales bacterium]
MQKLKLEELNRISESQIKTIQKKHFSFVLDNIRSLNNVGSVFRTADSFLAEKLYLCGITGTPPHRDIHKTALGATETVEWEYHEDILGLITNLKKLGYLIVALEQTTTSVSLNDFEPTLEDKYVFILGNEVEGVSDDVLSLCNNVIEIPQFGTKHSLNVSVVAGIIAWHFVYKTTTK